MDFDVASWITPLASGREHMSEKRRFAVGCSPRAHRVVYILTGSGGGARITGKSMC
ncbi:hypothetical protein BO1005MUT1_500003 [Hyphomicrobiales bacterium]|nr:hypothetical protein BO1005MUT1_500003 [Hyphomicrobiales bacterium]